LSRTRIKDILSAMRPHQWIKNLFIFPALIFSRHLFDPAYFLKSMAAFWLFCIVAGGIYMFNDLMDLEEDKFHPRKKQRPIASGRISPALAKGLFAVFSVSGIAAAFTLDLNFGIVVSFYFVMNMGYSLGLKRVVIIDVLIVSMGFVLRAAAGGLVIDVEVSPWLLVCTTLLALFLVLAKRRHELILLDERANMLVELSIATEDTEKATKYRKSLDEYNPYFLDQMIGITTASTLMGYILYTLSEDAIKKFGGTDLIYTVPFVIYGIFRYLYLIHMKRQGGNPAMALLRDWPLMVDVALWGLSVVVVLYVNLHMS